MRIGIGLAAAVFAATAAHGEIRGVATGKSFLREGRVQVGVNFWGSKHATQMWSKWDEASVDEDLRVLASHGMRLLRVFPNWADFQPIHAVTLNGGNWDKVNEMRMFPSEEKLPDTPAGFAGVDERMLERFERFCDLAEKHGLQLIVPVLTGQMTFRNLIPPALLHVNLFTDPTALKWEMRFVDCFVRRMKGKKAIVAWESGNETRFLATNTGPDLAEAWQRYIHSVIRLADDSRPIVGVDGLGLTKDAEWPTTVNAWLSDCVAVHPYHHISGTAYLDDANSMRLATFCAAQNLAQEDVAGKACFVEEHSYRRAPCSSRDLMARYIDGMLWNVWSVNGRAMLWWCAYDQDHLDIAPYDWRQVYLEFGIMKSDRGPYPYTEAMAAFQRFQDELPFEALPPVKRDAVFIVSDRDSVLASYILARQAGFFPKYVSPEDPLPDASVYFLPCAIGKAYLGTREWEALRRRVADGATLFISWEDTFLSQLHEVTGAEVERRLGSSDDGVCACDGFTVRAPGSVKATFKSLGAEVLGRDGNGDPVFFRNRYGKGTVYLLGFPLEKRLYALQGAFASDAWKIYATVVKRPQLVDDGARDVLESEHFFTDRKAAVILVNNSPKPHAGEVRLADGWRVTRTLTDRPDLAALEGGKLRLGVNAGLLVLMEK